MWVEDLPNGKYKYCERYTDTKGKTRKVSVTLDKNSSRAQNEASRLLYNKIDAKLEKKNKKLKMSKTKQLQSLSGKSKMSIFQFMKKQ